MSGTTKVATLRREATYTAIDPLGARGPRLRLARDVCRPESPTTYKSEGKRRMILFSGWGTLMLLMVGAGVMWLGDKVYAGVGAIVAGVFIGVTGRWLNTLTETEEDDLKTGQRTVRRNPNRLFFIPVQYWGILLVVAGLASLGG